MSHPAVGHVTSKPVMPQLVRLPSVFFASIFSALLLAGCASTPPAPRFSHAPVSDSHVASTDTADVSVEAADDIQILPVERDRVAQKVKARIEARKISNAAGNAPRSLQVVLRVTRYDKGSKFARAMLAGLGQIHLDGTISVFEMPAHTLVEEFDMQKTFAWGGLYGASTSMEEIEDTFADAIAATITGQAQASPKAKT